MADVPEGNDGRCGRNDAGSAASPPPREDMLRDAVTSLNNAAGLLSLSQEHDLAIRIAGIIEDVEVRRGW